MEWIRNLGLRLQMVMSVRGFFVVAVWGRFGLCVQQESDRES